MSFDKQENKAKESIYITKKDYKDKKRASESGNPEDCFDSLSERSVYYLFRDFYVLPITQHRIGKYFVDFAFPDINVVVEYDGPGHENQKECDLEREEYLRSQGWIVVRIVRKNSIFKYQVVENQIDKGCYKTMKQAVNYIVNEIRETRGKRPIDCYFDKKEIENEEDPAHWIGNDGEKYYS